MYMGGTAERFQTRDALVKKAGATLLLMTRASKLFPLKRVRLIKILLHDGTGVMVGVLVMVGVILMVGVVVIVGVKVIVAVGVGVRVAVGVRVDVGVGINVGVNVGDGVSVLVFTVAITSNGVLMARVPRNCSTVPSR